MTFEEALELTKGSVDHLLEVRRQSRLDKDFKLSDAIRNHLLTENIVIKDLKDFQEVTFYPKNKPLSYWLEKEEQSRKAERIFDAWLFSMQESIKINKDKK